MKNHKSNLLYIKHIVKTFILILILGYTQVVHAQTKFGNYKDSRIGDTKNQNMDMLLYFPDREWLYDFDTTNPLKGVLANSGTIATSTDYFMTSPQSMKWTTAKGSSLMLEANIILKPIYRNQYTLSVGLFQEDIPTGIDKRVFKIELLSPTNTVLHSREMYLHKGGWNILCSELKFTGTQSISKVRITQTAGASGKIYIDNFLIFANQNSRNSIGSSGVENEKLWMEDKIKYPTTKLTQEEKEAFLTIAERVIPLPSKIASIPESTMNAFRALHARYNIQTKGVYANGVNPCYYYRSYDYKDQETVNTMQYLYNQELCKQMESMGKAWYQTNDTKQKKELGDMITDIVRLATTYGGMPNAWYNGRGFAEGVYYSRELLEQNGLLDKATDLIILQYSIDLILYGEHQWELAKEHSERGPEFFWSASADDLNTASMSTILGVLAEADTAEKARNMRRLKNWLDTIALNYSPSTDGTLKPDGSWFHHWGNRFDNYGWVGAWKGATNWVWWMSHTPFAVSKETKKRLNHMADVHFEVMNKDGYVGPQDAMHKIPSDGFLNLAKAGSPDGTKEIDVTMASYWLAYPEEPSYKQNTSLVNQLKKQNIEPAKKQDGNLTLSYDISNIHRRGEWQVYTRGIAKDFYHTQYERGGYLFYSIGGISLVKEGKATGMQRIYGSSLMARHNEDLKNITVGYNFSRALGVTAINTDFSKLNQMYYQRGSSTFVGGTSTSNGNGIFVQEFNGKENTGYSGRIAEGLQFKKSYFYFGNDIVFLASGISNNGDNTSVETGLLQEPVTSGKNEFSLANGVTTVDSNYDTNYSSSDVPWMFNNSLNLGVFLMPNQNYKLFKGSQTFGTLTGDIISTYLTHNGQTDGWYECILRLNTTKSDMQKLAMNMNNSKPLYKVLRRDAKAHIVHNENTKSTGYAIFDTTGLVLPEGILQSVDKQCVVMLEENNQGLNLSVSYPDKKIEKTTTNPLGWSLPNEVTFVLNGKYNLKNTDLEKNSVRIEQREKSTIIKAMLKDGLPLNFNLISKTR